MPDSERGADLSYVLVPVLERKRRRASDHAQPGQSSQRVEQLLGQTVRKVGLIPAGTQIGERKAVFRVCRLDGLRPGHIEFARCRQHLLTQVIEEVNLPALAALHKAAASGSLSASR